MSTEDPQPEPPEPLQASEQPSPAAAAPVNPATSPIASAPRHDEPANESQVRQNKRERARRSLDRFKFNSGEPLKPLTIIITALVAFVFGIASNQSTDLVKGADDCYDALTQYDENVSSDFWELNHDFHLPGAWEHYDQPDQQQRLRQIARKYNTEIDSVYLKIKSKCPVTGPNKYLNKKDVEAFNNDHYELSKNCFEASECSDERADIVQRNSVNSTETIIKQAGEVSQWGLARRGWYAISNPW